MTPPTRGRRTTDGRSGRSGGGQRDGNRGSLGPSGKESVWCELEARTRGEDTRGEVDSAVTAGGGNSQHAWYNLVEGKRASGRA